MSNNKQIKAVLFDLDDTLIDWSKKTVKNVNRKHIENIRVFLQNQGHPTPSQDEFQELFYNILIPAWGEAKKTWAGVNFGDVVLQTVRAADIDATAVKLDDLLLAYDWQPVPGIEPYEDTLPLLSYLKENGYKIGLITNSMQPMWMRDVELETYGIMPFLDARVTSGDVGYMKPHPNIYNAALEKLDVPPHEALFVGDRPGNDIVGANDVGMVSVWIDPPHLNYDLDGVEPNYHITYLKELIPILESLL